MMWSIDQHISNWLSQLLEKEDEKFDLLFSFITTPQKENFRQDLFYIHKVLDYEMGREASSPKFIHLHFIGEASVPTTLLAEFIAIKQYLLHLQNAEEDSLEEDDYFQAQAKIFRAKLSKPVIAPPNAIGKRRVFQEVIGDRERLREMSKFLEQISDLPHVRVASIEPRSMINLLKKDSKVILEQNFDTRKFAVEIDGSNIGSCFENSSFVIINNDYSLDSLVEVKTEQGNSVLSGLENVICIDSESRVQFQSIDLAQLEQLNSSEGAVFRNLIVISFEREHFRLGKLIDRVDRIRSRFRAGKPSKHNPNSYLFLPQEWHSTKVLPIPSSTEVIWVDGENEEMEAFLQIIQDRENLFELWSIKMRNVYAMAWNEQCVKLIIEDIFGYDAAPCTIELSTRNAIHQLPKEIVTSIKSGLENILQNIRSLETHKKLLQHVSGFGRIRLIISELVKAFPALFKEVQGCFMDKKVCYETWSANNGGGNQCTIVLAYRDPGKFPFMIYPNLFENPFLDDRFLGVFPAMLFKRNYLRSTSNYRKELFGKLLNHPIRREWFDWKKLMDSISVSTQNEDKEDTELWDEDNAFREPTDRETITFEFERGGQRIYSLSQQFLVRFGENGKTDVLRGHEISEREVESGLGIQCLDSLYEEINLFEVSPKDEDARKAIQKQYGLTSSDATTQIWKQLLRLRCTEQGEQSVYEEISERVAAAKNNLQMVSFSHFSKAWLDLEDSTLIPRSKALFKIVCTMLMLPENYYRIMLRKRANDRLLSRKSTFKMNALLTDLVRDGAFNRDEALELSDEIFAKYGEQHDLEDIGISEENAATEMRALVSLLRPYLNLQKVKKLNTTRA